MFDDLGFCIDENVPSWHITQVAVSIKCGPPTWRQTFITQNNLLKEFQPSYISQESNISKALNRVKCADMYKNLEKATSADPSDFSVFNQTRTDYKERFVKTFDNYVECVNKKGTNYTLSPKGTSEDMDYRDLLTLFGSWLNVSQQSTKISFECLIQATANLTTPIITMTIVLQRYRRLVVSHI